MTSRPNPAKTKAHWDQLAGGYDAAKARNSFYYEQLKSLVSTWVPPEGRTRVLDAGCGTGQILAHLEPACGVGIDSSANMIREAKVRCADRTELTFQVADAEQLADLGLFEAVVSADVLEHVPDWEAVVSAMVGACRIGGRIVITTPNPRWALPLWILEKLRLKMPEGPHDYVAGRAVAGALARQGCSVRHEGTHLLVPVELGGLGRRLSAVAERLPVLRRLGVIQLIVAERTLEFPAGSSPGQIASSAEAESVPPDG